MKILSITAQKPDSTGSGVYLSELVKGFDAMGHEQTVVAGLYRESKVSLPENVRLYPVYFKSRELPFPIAGMSDEMPYESTVYSQMTEEMTEQFLNVFRGKISEAIESFHPDMILAHHLYLVTAAARECAGDIPVYGFCHNTDLRQMKKHDLRKKYIREQIGRLDGIYALHEEQKKEILDMYPVREEKIEIIGTGYNHHIFYPPEDEKREKSSAPTLVFAGKISRAKGVESLLKSLFLLKEDGLEDLKIILAGGSGNAKEYAAIRALAKACPYMVEFAGKLSQKELAEVYRAADVFVLPSFYEGLPLTLIEAIVCGDKAVMTDLPGIRPFVEAYIPDAQVWYVTPPSMKRADEPAEGTLGAFERRLAVALRKSLAAGYTGAADMSSMTWEAVCRKILNRYMTER